MLRVRAVRTVYYDDRRYREGEEFFYREKELPKSGSLILASEPLPEPAASKRGVFGPKPDKPVAKADNAPVGNQEVI